MIDKYDSVALVLKKGSWENLFDCIRNGSIKSEGNLWASVQHLESQLEEIVEKHK